MVYCVSVADDVSRLSLYHCQPLSVVTLNAVFMLFVTERFLTCVSVAAGLMSDRRRACVTAPRVPILLWLMLLMLPSSKCVIYARGHDT